tara:strand:- start:428 stop:1984 length:1557 start_codon:yes stop_codon:yes gene_type:complete
MSSGDFIYNSTNSDLSTESNQMKWASLLADADGVDGVLDGRKYIAISIDPSSEGKIRLFSSPEEAMKNRFEVITLRKVLDITSRVFKDGSAYSSAASIGCSIQFLASKLKNSVSSQKYMRFLTSLGSFTKANREMHSTLHWYANDRLSQVRLAQSFLRVSPSPEDNRSSFYESLNTFLSSMNESCMARDEKIWKGYKNSLEGALSEAISEETKISIHGSTVTSSGGKTVVIQLPEDVRQDLLKTTGQIIQSEHNKVCHIREGAIRAREDLPVELESPLELAASILAESNELVLEQAKIDYDTGQLELAFNKDIDLDSIDFKGINLYNTGVTALFTRDHERAGTGLDILDGDKRIHEVAQFGLEPGLKTVSRRFNMINEILISKSDQKWFPLIQALSTQAISALTGGHLKNEVMYMGAENGWDQLQARYVLEEGRTPVQIRINRDEHGEIQNIGFTQNTNSMLYRFESAKRYLDETPNYYLADGEGYIAMDLHGVATLNEEGQVVISDDFNVTHTFHEA